MPAAALNSPTLLIRTAKETTYPKVVTIHPIVLVTRAYPIHQRWSKNKVEGMSNLTISGISRIQLITIPTPFQAINLLNQIQKRQIKVPYSTHKFASLETKWWNVPGNPWTVLHPNSRIRRRRYNPTGIWSCSVSISSTAIKKRRKKGDVKKGGENGYPRYSKSLVSRWRIESIYMYGE